MLLPSLLPKIRLEATVGSLPSSVTLLRSILPYITGFSILSNINPLPLTHYSDEQISQIRDLAAALTPISDIAILMDLDVYQLRDDLADLSNPVSKAYRHAKAETMLSIRRNELQLASMGSPLAVQLAGSYLINMNNDEDL